jgi:amino acid transporter
MDCTHRHYHRRLFIHRQHRRTKYGGAVQTVTTIGKLIPIVCIIVFGLWQGNEHIFSTVTESIASQNFGAAVLATLFAYDGWILLAALGGEMKNPEKVLPKAMTGGILIVTAATCSLTWRCFTFFLPIRLSSLAKMRQAQPLQCCSDRSAAS